MKFLGRKILDSALNSNRSSLNPINKSRILQTICESNFHKLFRLAPDLPRIRSKAIANAGGRPALYIRILERNPYTITLELTHHFEATGNEGGEPAVKVRVYLDTRSAEVLCDTWRPTVSLVLQKNPAPEIVLDYKWTINYFLERWLDHCIEQGYCFGRVGVFEPATS